jgi:hypothetical protein
LLQINLQRELAEVLLLVLEKLLEEVIKDRKLDLEEK